MWCEGCACASNQSDFLPQDFLRREPLRAAMDLLGQYDSDEDVAPMRVPDSAPAVDTTGLALAPWAGVVVPLAATKSLHGARCRPCCPCRSPHQTPCVLADPSRHVVYTNPRVSDLEAPVAGPAHPYRLAGALTGERNHPTGHVEVRTAGGRVLQCGPLAACVPLAALWCVPDTGCGVHRMRM